MNYEKEEEIHRLTQMIANRGLSPEKKAEVYFKRGCLKDDCHDYKGAVKDLDKSISLKPDYCDAYVYRADLRTRRNNYDGALSDYNMAIGNGMENEKVYRLRAELHCEMGNPQDALADYDKALQFEPQSMKLLSARGKIKHDMGDFYGAIADFEKMIGIKPEDGSTYFLRGQSRQGIEDYAGAQKDFTQAIRLGFELPDVYHQRSRARLLLGDPKGAIADCNKALKWNTFFFYPEYFNTKALAYIMLHDYTKAILTLDKTLSEEPDNVEAHEIRFSAWVGLEDYEAARDEAHYLLEEYPDNPFYNFSFGFACLKIGSHQEALAAFNKTLEINPDDAEAYYYRGEAKFMLEDIEGAKSDYQHAKELDDQYDTPATWYGI